MSRTDRFEHIRGGIEISDASHSSSGTLGYIVRDNRTFRAAILTNRHVVSEHADEVKMNLDLIAQRAKDGRFPTFCSREYFDKWLAEYKNGNWRPPIFQPAFKGGMNPAARLVAYLDRASSVSDAAICPLIDGVQYACDAVAVNYFHIPGAAAPKEGLLVMKSGKVTGLTYGRIRQIEGETLLIEPVPRRSIGWPAEVHNPDNVQAIGGADAIGAAGDSGSVWVSADLSYFPRHAVGLLYKGHPNGMSIANNINTIMTKLDFSFVSTLDILD